MAVDLTRLRRRSFLALVAGSALLPGAAGGAGRDGRKLCGRRRRRATGVTDTDSGANADPANYGRGAQPSGGGEPRHKAMQQPGRATGITDRDSGPRADPVNRGRGRRRPNPITDGDRGAYSDAPCGGS